MLDAALQALATLVEPERLMFMMAGVGLGLIVGFVPGLSGSTGLAIMLPFMFGMDPVNGVALLIGLAVVNNTSDSFMSVMVGVPGSSSAQATIMDGYPMAKQGKATTALAAAFVSSAAGGVIGALVLLVGVWFAAPLVLAMGAPELFMMTVLGLSTVAILTKGAPGLGLLSAALGLVLGTVGVAPNSPTPRFTFDSVYLLDGISLAVISLGLFAVPEIIELLASRRPISPVPAQKGGRREGILAVVKHWKLVGVMSALSNLLGVIPGIGGAVIDWIVYGLAKHTLKNTENFGRGDIRGVIAPEASNNAKEGGALLPTLLFGIPGSTSMALLLSAFFILGLSVGPEAVTDDLPITLTIVWTIALANVVATIICLGASGPIARLCHIPAEKLMPFLIVALTIAAYQSARHWGDIVTLFIVGAVGYWMKKIGCPRPPFLIGFVLSVPAERYLLISMERFGTSWFVRPGVLIILGIVAVVVVGGMLLQNKSKQYAEEVTA